ncbi:hypothetical protein DSO57_1015857 [Entomophthora muscae]|uniref:Uncharacterized protein n=1 Tax=Entomophthora muscae TaxID=34485 RepID=A0ACC2UQT9_9FUNG|nr:hypothetical protein DSO57_1015857 [Entomophthora muscae]
MLNGCLCCVLVGQMKTALLEMKEKFNPDRILIETSGSAFPAPIAWQVRQLSQEGFVLDAIVTVVDCMNFMGYEDKSYTAKLQAQYTDLIILNKHELVTQEQLDLVIDRVNDLNTDTPKIRYDFTNGADPDLMLGLDSQLFLSSNSESFMTSDHHKTEIDIIQISTPIDEVSEILSKDQISTFLSNLDKEDVFRVKGLVRCSEDDVPRAPYLVNFAFSRGSWSPVTESIENIDNWNSYHYRLTVMGLDLASYRARFLKALKLDESQITYHPANHRHQ